MTTVIEFATDSLEDNIAFSPYAEKFQEMHGGRVYVKTIWNAILYSENPNVYFVDKYMEIRSDKYYTIKFNFTNTPLQKIICDQLGLEYAELVPKIKTNGIYTFNKKKKYVCISTQSTAQLKYWNNNNGWDKVVRYLKELKYDVYVIDKNSVFGTSEKWNNIPKTAIDDTGEYPIEYRIAQIKNCHFFIGLSSGLSWLAWALGKKVITISGCTEEYNEFVSNNYRVINKNGCYGCLNDPYINNKDRIKSDGWLYCPRNKKFECSKEISFNMVKQKIDELMAKV